MEDSKLQQQEGSVPVAKQALAQKRDVRDLNTRLEMYVRGQNEKKAQITQLQKAMAKQEIEYRNKLDSLKSQYEETIQRLETQNQALRSENHIFQVNSEETHKTIESAQNKFLAAEAKNASLRSQIDNQRAQLERDSRELESLRTLYASIKFKYDTICEDKNQFNDRIHSVKNKYVNLQKLLSQKEAELKFNCESSQRLVIEKNVEIDNLAAEVKELELRGNSTQSRLRKEFDSKLAEFVQKREEQYKQEKFEWMRIFKEEFNRKLRSFKEANHRLTAANQTQEKDISEHRLRISKLKQQKTELEVTNRSLENELDKIRNDLDELRRMKDLEMKEKQRSLSLAIDQFKAKELQFDELCGIKMQLDAEIDLYRKILNEAEQRDGYQSPLCNAHNTNGRKRRRITRRDPVSTLLNNQTNDDNQLQNDGINDGAKVPTPGLVRAALNVQNDIKEMNMTDMEEMKDEEDNNNNNIINNQMEEDSDNNDNPTPDGDGNRLMFSSLDLVKGMIEVQNVGDNLVKLKGYTLSNKDGSSQFPLPNNLNLSKNEKLRIYVGSQFSSLIDQPAEAHLDVVDEEYDGQYVFWTQDPWKGESDDCARLYNPNANEVSRVEISPDMIPNNDERNKGCQIM